MTVGRSVAVMIIYVSFNNSVAYFLFWWTGPLINCSKAILWCCNVAKMTLGEAEPRSIVKAGAFEVYRIFIIFSELSFSSVHTQSHWVELKWPLWISYTSLCHASVCLLYLFIHFVKPVMNIGMNVKMHQLSRKSNRLKIPFKLQMLKIPVQRTNLLSNAIVHKNNWL